MNAADIHAHIGAAWPVILEQLGIPGTGNRKQRPCPACGGTDRFVGDNRHGRGDYLCRRCGAGDGFSLLMKVHNWTFSQARSRVIEVAGLRSHDAGDHGYGGGDQRQEYHHHGHQVEQRPANPTRRVRDLLRTACAVEDCQDARAYLASRALWPLPPGCTLRAHAGAEYFDGGKRIGRFSALVAKVRDVNDEAISAHITYLQNGRKLAGNEPRKLLSPLTGRRGCAVNLAPIESEVLGIAEGIETALSAMLLNTVPTWSALNAALLAKFEPPAQVRRLVIFADRDAPGLEAAAALMQRLQGRIEFEMRLPPAPASDWNDALRANGGKTHD